MDKIPRVKPGASLPLPLIFIFFMMSRKLENLTLGGSKADLFKTWAPIIIFI